MSLAEKGISGRSSTTQAVPPQKLYLMPISLAEKGISGRNSTTAAWYSSSALLTYLASVTARVRSCTIRNPRVGLCGSRGLQQSRSLTHSRRPW